MVLQQDLHDLHLLNSAKVVAIIAKDSMLVHYYLHLHLLDSPRVNLIILLDSINFHYSNSLHFQHSQTAKHLQSLTIHLNLALNSNPMNSIPILAILIILLLIFLQSNYLQRCEYQFLLFIHIQLLLDPC